MSMTLWIDTDSEETIELGPTMECYKAFAEMKHLVGDEVWAKRFSALDGVLTQCELQEDADPSWLEEVREEATLLLREQRSNLSVFAVGVLEALSEG